MAISAIPPLAGPPVPPPEGGQAQAGSSGLFPSLVWARHLVQHRLVAGTPGAAEALLREVLARDPLEAKEVLARPYWTLAEAYARLGNAAEARRLVALAEAEKVPEPSPIFGVRDRMLGLIALAENNPQEAVARLRASSQVSHCIICSLYDLGRAHEAAGQGQQAIAAYERYATAPDESRLNP